MTTYTTLSDTTLEQDKPVTQSVMRALRDNPLAIAEGASTAPLTVGLNADVSVTASNATSLQYVGGFNSSYNYFEVIASKLLPSNSSSTKLYCSYTVNAGSSWSSNFEIASFTLTREFFLKFTLVTPNTASDQRFFGWYAESTPATGIKYISFSNGSAINGIRFTFDASNISGNMVIRRLRLATNVG